MAGYLDKHRDFAFPS